MHIKFLALIFIGLALLAVTTARFGEPITSCECSGRRHWTQHCCGESRGFLKFDRCFEGFSSRFLRCCEFKGQTGACNS